MSDWFFIKCGNCKSEFVKKIVYPIYYCYECGETCYRDGNELIPELYDGCYGHLITEYQRVEKPKWLNMEDVSKFIKARNC